MNDDVRENRNTALVFILISIFAFGVYYDSLFYGESNYDDHVYFDYLAATLNNGLNLDSLFLLVTDFVNSNWHPLTVLSLATDYIVSDKNLIFYHFMNTIIHILNATLIYVVFIKLTRNKRASVLTAIIFTIHPLNVETVVWISERKGLLSTFFALCSIYFYILYKEKLINRFRVISVLFFALSLLSKPTTAPVVFILSLLDITILNKHDRISMKMLFHSLIEKYLYFIIGGVIIILSFMAQSETGALRDLSSVTIPQRIETGLYNIFIYISKIYFPISLASYYPHPDKPFYIIFLYAVFLISWLYIAFKYFSHHKILTFCIMFFFILIIPQSGIFQTGSHSIANRYSYLPSVGMFFILSYWVSRLANLKIFMIVSLCIVIPLTVVSVRQSKAWSSNLTLWEHNARVTEENYYTAYFYSMILAQNEKVIEATKYFYNTIGINNKYYGNEAITDFSKELTKRKYYAEAKAILLKGVEEGFSEKDIINQLALLEYFYFNNKIVGKDYIQSVLKVVPDNFNANRIYANMLIDEKKYSEALIRLNKMYEKRSSYKSEGESIASILERDIKKVRKLIHNK